jgi:hypothetical protein
MTQLDICLGIVAPYYNLVLVIIIVPLFIKLLRIKNKKINLKPWRVLFIAFGVYVIEEALTVLNGLGITDTPRILTSLFELVIISLFIYMLLLQKEILTKK